MGRPVEFADVAARLDEFGPLATLVTVTPEATPHVGWVLVTIGETTLAVRVGSRSRDNVLANSAVTLAWVRDDGDYQLIVDGVATVADEPDGTGLSEVSITVERGILHRLAGRADAGPTCRPLQAQATT